MPNHSSAPDPSRPDGVLKIGFVLDDTLDRPDGVQQYVLGLGEWLRRRGHEVRYLAGGTSRQDVAGVHALSRNVPVRFNGNRLSVPLPASRPVIRTLLEREAFDVLHVQTPYSPLLAGRVIAAAGPRTAVVGTFHIVPRHWLASAASRLLAVWCRPTMRRFDAMLSVSAAAQDFARRAFGVASVVLPNAVALGRFRGARPLSAADPAVPTVLFLGRLVPRKGCMTLLQAAVQLRAERPELMFRLVICGAGPLEAELRRYAADSGLDGIIQFTGFVSEADKPRYYAGAAITVFPSQGGESFGIVLLEAMASGRAAVLAGDNAGYRSVLGGCPHHVLFDPARPAALAQRLAALLTDEPERRRIAAWQRRRAEDFSAERVGRELEAVYRAALRRRRSMR